MDIDKMLAELRAEREAIEEAIITLERLEGGRAKRRGRPPAWLSELRAHHAERTPASEPKPVPKRKAEGA